MQILKVKPDKYVLKLTFPFFFKFQLNIITLNTCTPSPVVAEQGWICHVRPRIFFKSKPWLISEAGEEVKRSCLLANTSRGTIANLSSANNSSNSCDNKKDCQCILKLLPEKLLKGTHGDHCMVYINLISK